MLVRSRPSSLEFLNRVRRYHDDHKDLSEQDCIRDVVNQNANGEADQTHWIPQNKMNAFPEEIRCWDQLGGRWEKGMFVVHFAGAWAYIKEEDPTGILMRKYEPEIIWS
jgi:mannan polymerase II complex MNN10 subunit